jgi:hypothetical protein
MYTICSMFAICSICELQSKNYLSMVVSESPKMNEIAQWAAIVVMFFGLGWLYFCIYHSDR